MTIVAHYHGEQLYRSTCAQSANSLASQDTETSNSTTTALASYCSNFVIFRRCLISPQTQPITASSYLLQTLPFTQSPAAQYRNNLTIRSNSLLTAKLATTNPYSTYEKLSVATYTAPNRLILLQPRPLQINTAKTHSQTTLPHRTRLHTLKHAYPGQTPHFNHQPHTQSSS